MASRRLTQQRTAAALAAARMTAHVTWRRRDTLAGVTLAYTASLVAWLPVAPWMVATWAVVAVVLVVVATGITVLDRVASDETSAPVETLHRMFPALTATACFAVVAVLSANLETPAHAGDPVVYAGLAAGTVLVVALYLVSYDRGRQKPPWK